MAARAPKILAAVATAGYAKSSVIRTYARTLGASAVCDYRETRDVVDFAQRTAAALVAGDARAEARVAEQRIAAAVDSSAWIEFVTALWDHSYDHATYVFENLEDVVEDARIMDVLARLLARTPQHRMVAICTRRNPPLGLGRFAPPHEVLTLRENELAFDESEIRGVFRDSAVSARAIDRVAEITRGWPVAVLLFERLARAKRLAVALEQAGTLDFSDLYDYLAQEALAAIGPQQFQRLLAVAAIPGVTGAEIALVLDDPDAPEALRSAATGSAFVYRLAGGSYEAHPLVRTMLRERYAEQCRDLLSLAAQRLEASDALRSAQLYQLAGDNDKAAGLLEGKAVIFADELSPRFAEVVSGFDVAVLLRHPSIWSNALTNRSIAISQRQWLYEALAVRERLDECTPLETRVNVLTGLANILTNLGQHEDALAVLQKFSSSKEALPPRYRSVAQLIRAAIAVRRGQFTYASEIWHGAEPHFENAPTTRAIGLEEIVARVHHFNGERSEERATLDRSIALANETGVAVVRALALQEALFGAWFAGEDALVAQYARELERAIAPNTSVGTEVLRSAVHGDISLVLREETFERFRFRHYAALIACGRAPRSERLRFADAALEAAKSADEPACAAVSAIALAECEPKIRIEMIERAMQWAQRTDSLVLRESIEAYRAGSADLGLLGPMVQRLRDEPAARRMHDREAPQISVFTATVTIGAKTIRLAPRERELLFYLALAQRACSRAELLETIWPGSSEHSPSVLRVYVSRIRTRMRDPQVISLLESGDYQIAPYVRIDLDDAENALKIDAEHRALDAATRELLSRCALTSAVPASISSWEWFAPYARHALELSRRAALLLAADAIERGVAGEARAYADRLIAFDAYDEAAWEVLIRASLAAGDAASARRSYRKFSELLSKELNSSPSAKLRELVTPL
ncbi:MAG: winged helix-turn-helix domain-containing protein [Candidatus Aquilonibacter sp.]